MCDVDEFTVVVSDFYLVWPYREYEADEFTEYIFNTTWRCDPDDPDDDNDDMVKCYQD